MLFQQYSNCIRTEQGYCSISYAAVSTSTFSLSGTTGTTYTAVSGVSCSQDYLIIQQGGACPAPTNTATTIERFCGTLLAPPGAGETRNVTLLTKCSSCSLDLKIHINAKTKVLTHVFLGTTAASVCSYSKPFILGVSFDGSEVSN